MLQIEITIDKIKNIYLLISTLRQQSGLAKRHTHSMRISFASAPAKGPKTGADVNFLNGSNDHFGNDYQLPSPCW